ncbi:Uncharacterised protein [Mycobacteroides abscessus subsp. abscessus]|nr:Uncharacterised protein [Mycobacteroides abscessus subsp. abscessus]SKZ44534.1 Uncharacterised protein [Mycobacteroides abscessus subsp. abscessus]
MTARGVIPRSFCSSASGLRTSSNSGPNSSRNEAVAPLA